MQQGRKRRECQKHLNRVITVCGNSGNKVVKVLYYIMLGRWFDHTKALGSNQPPPEMNITNISGG